MIVIQSGNASSRIDIVFDVYKDNSIKTTEREDRESYWLSPCQYCCQSEDTTVEETAEKFNK